MVKVRDKGVTQNPLEAHTLFQLKRTLTLSNSTVYTVCIWQVAMDSVKLRFVEGASIYAQKGLCFTVLERQPVYVHKCVKLSSASYSHAEVILGAVGKSLS